MSARGRHGWALAALLLGGACASSPPGTGTGADAGAADADTGGDPMALVLPPLAPCDAGAPVPERVRVATWNVAIAGFSSIDTLARELREIDADVVLLQELEVGARRSGRVNQPRALAEAMGMDYAFAPSVPYDGGIFGLTVLTRLPLARAERHSLDGEIVYEPRIAFEVGACAGALELRLIDVHAEYVPETNTDNLARLAELIGPVGDQPIAVAGDLNTRPANAGIVALLADTGLVDLFHEEGGEPAIYIDYVLASPPLAEIVRESVRVDSDASDHAPLWVEFDLSAWADAIPADTRPAE